MKKLIDLLNEYSIIIDDRITWEYNTPLHIWGEGELEYNVSIWRIISKKFGFIKRLIEKDKIYRDKVENKADFEFTCNYVYKKDEIEDKLLMLLAIQDEPINFLIQLLK